jgi:hypothetical protein
MSEIKTNTCPHCGNIDNFSEVDQGTVILIKCDVCWGDVDVEYKLCRCRDAATQEVDGVWLCCWCYDHQDIEVVKEYIENNKTRRREIV